MALHLITSAQEEDHISSSDDARLYEAIVGSGGIVFGRGNKMSASMTDPNTMRIMDGEALLSGRYWNITNYEEVNITNGTPGMNSIALVVCNVKTDPQEVVTLKVYEGVETTGDPVMPSYIEGDLNSGDTEAEMPLYAVTKTGLSVGDPVPQFEPFLSAKEFRDSISLVSSSKQGISLPTGASPYAQITFEFTIPANQKIVAVAEIMPNRPAACAISGYQLIESNKLEVWFRNVLGEGTTLSVDVSVLTM